MKTSKAHLIALSAIVAAFTSGAGTPSPSYAADPEIITLSGAGPQGRWFKESSLFGKVLTEALDDKPTVNGVTVQGSSVGNSQRMPAGMRDGGR